LWTPVFSVSPLAFRLVLYAVAHACITASSQVNAAVHAVMLAGQPRV
jgi:hypothetical protein